MSDTNNDIDDVHAALVLAIHQGVEPTRCNLCLDPIAELVGWKPNSALARELRQPEGRTTIILYGSCAAHSAPEFYPTAHEAKLMDDWRRERAELN